MNKEYELMPVLCLDLDGTVRYSKNGGFISNPTDTALYDGVEERIWEYRDKGYLVFGITNQGGVAYGMKTPEGHDAEISFMTSLFKRDLFHLIVGCFHHPYGHVEPYNHRSLSRKPDIGMLVVFERKAWEQGHIVDWDNSLFVGDRPEDEQCAQNARIPFQWADEFFNREANENE